MANHGSATAREETPHVIETRITISDAIKRRAQSLINDISVDPRWQSVIRYGLETNDPWLPEVLRGMDAGTTVFDTITSLAKAEDQLA